MTFFLTQATIYNPNVIKELLFIIILNNTYFYSSKENSFNYTEVLFTRMKIGMRVTQAQIKNGIGYIWTTVA